MLISSHDNRNKTVDRRISEQIIKGCQEMAEIYLALEREFHPLEEEVNDLVDRLLGAESK